MFQNKHFNPNYTRIKEGLERGWEWGCDLISQCSPFFWNNFSTGKNLLKRAKYLASPNKNLTSWRINNVIIH